MEQVHLDQERQTQAKVYARIQRRMMLVDLAIAGFYTLAWLLFGWSVALKEYLLRWTDNQLLLVAGFALVFGASSTRSTAFVLLPGLCSSASLRAIQPDAGGWDLGSDQGVLLAEYWGSFCLRLFMPSSTPPLRPGGCGLPAFYCFHRDPCKFSSCADLPAIFLFVPLGDEYAELSERLVRLAEQAGTRVRGSLNSICPEGPRLRTPL
jgi:hypothetical protein